MGFLRVAGSVKGRCRNWNYKYCRWKQARHIPRLLIQAKMIKLKACSHLNFSSLLVIMCPSVQGSRKYMEIQGGESQPEIQSS